MIDMKDRGVLTESMFYVLMSFLHREMCGIEITEFVEQKTNGRVRLGPGTLYTLLGKFQDEHLIEETQTDGRKRSYRLTERGRAVFKDELARLKACVLDGEEEFFMSKTVIRITPVGGFDIPGLENWFAVMAGKGLRFSMTTGPLTIFEKTAQQTVQIHLEPIRGAVNDDPELNALYEDAGWHYWGIFRGSFYVFASDDLTAQAHTDSETQDYALKRFFKEKVIGGVLLAFGNVLLLSLYQNGSPWEIDWTWLRYYPVETFSNRPVLPFLLTAFGLLLIDLSYLLGLFHLLCYRKAIKSGTVPKRHERVGWLLAIGFAFLLPVFINTIQLFAGTDYRPYDLAGSGFITLTDIEGEDLPLSRDVFYSMDYISHGGTLLDPESWYFHQYGAFNEDDSPNDVPHLEVIITRYPLDILAEMRAEEWSRQKFNNSGDYQQFDVLDECLYAKREGRTHVNEITGEPRVFLPGGILVLRRGDTVLFADYYGEQDLSEHIEHFAQMLMDL